MQVQSEQGGGPAGMDRNRLESRQGRHRLDRCLNRCLACNLNPHVEALVEVQVAGETAVQAVAAVTDDFSPSPRGRPLAPSEPAFLFLRVLLPPPSSPKSPQSEFALSR